MKCSSQTAPVYADRRRRPDHPGLGGTRHAPGPARRSRDRGADPRRRS